jgi:hypothetical protein
VALQTPPSEYQRETHPDITPFKAEATTQGWKTTAMSLSCSEDSTGTTSQQKPHPNSKQFLLLKILSCFLL